MPTNVEITIEEAFADVPPPSEEDLCASVGDEPYEDTDPFRGRRWQDLVDPDFLDRYQYALFWFTPEAFHYYLPAFLKAGLLKPDAIFVVSILQLLQPTDAGTSAAFRRQRWELLTDIQTRAFDEWLRWLIGQTTPGGVFEEEVKEALQVVRDRFWW